MMKKIFHQIKSSIYNPNFYQSLQTKTLGFSLSYYFRFSLCLALLVTILASLILVPVTVGFLSELKSTLPGLYPEALEIVVDKGKVTINQPEPYFIDLPADQVRLDIPDLDFKHLITIDTVSAEPAQKYNDYETLVLVTKDHFIYREHDKTGGDLAPLVTQALPTDLDLKINQTSALATFDRFSRYFIILPPLLVLGLFIGLVLFFAFSLLYLTILALIVWFISKWLGSKNWSFGFVYRVIIHASTLGLLLQMLWLIFGLNPFVMLLTLTVITGFVVSMNFRTIPAPLA